jgi:microcin C transport system substrate-binding protein
VVTDVPIGTGPYKIGKVDFGKDIEYVRDPNYWARDLGVRKGMFNFDRITYKMYKDTTAQFEGFKAGEFDYIQAFVAREWARGYKGKLFDNGTLIKKELKHGNAGDFQGFMFNTRLPKFQDKRVRQAIVLADAGADGQGDLRAEGKLIKKAVDPDHVGAVVAEAAGAVVL